jgi:hypothetical protein
MPCRRSTEERVNSSRPELLVYGIEQVRPNSGRSAFAHEIAVALRRDRLLSPVAREWMRSCPR